MIRSFTSALAALGVGLCGCTNDTGLDDDYVETRVHPDFVGELNTWEKSKTRNFTWEILIADEDGDRSRISVTQYPGQASAQFKVESTCYYEVEREIFLIRNTAEFGSRTECNGSISKFGFKRREMVDWLNKTPIPPESIVRAIRTMRDQTPNQIDVPVDDYVVKNG